MMDPLTMAGLISGGASLLGNVFSSDQTAKNTQAQIAAQEQMQSQTEQYNAQQAGINREFQSQQINQMDLVNRQNMAEQQAYESQMSNTAYQRASNDMKRAGLNPMMMFGSGGAASTPGVAALGAGAASGSSASVGTPNVPMPQKISALSNLGQIASTALSAAQGIQSLQKQAADIDLTRAQKNEVDSRKFGIELDNQRKQGGPGAGPTEAGAAENRARGYQADVLENDALRAKHESEARSSEAGSFADKSVVYTKPIAQAADAALPWVHSAGKAIKYLMPSKSTTESVSSDGKSTFQQRYEGGMFGGLGYKPLSW